MKMRKIESPIITNTKPLELKKSGDHLMIYDLTENLDDLKRGRLGVQVGFYFALSFVFSQKRGRVTFVIFLIDCRSH